MSTSRVLSGNPIQEKSPDLMYRLGGAERQWLVATNNPDTQTRNLDRLREYLGELLRTEHINVLAGAGSSMGVWRERQDRDEDERVVPTRMGLWQKATEIWDGDFEELTELVKYDPAEHGEDIELLLSQCYLAQSFSPDDRVEAFTITMKQAIVEACRFVDAVSRLDTHELFIRRVARRSRRLPRLKIFTTNYDLCFERTAHNANFIVVDGFSHTLPQEFDSSYFSYDLVTRGNNEETPDYVPNVFHLYKLHGSVDWTRHGGHVFRATRPDDPLLIYPSSSKFESSYEPPFIDMMARFQAALREPNSAVIIVGHGFADNHLTQPILSAVRSNVSLRLVVVDPICALENRPAPLRWLEELIDAGDTRLCLIAGKFDDFVRIMPDPDVRTEAEMHLERIRSHRR